MKKGFTLIELLVVVLIMGVLAAIALPQYQKAVRRARIAEAKVLLKSIGDALSRHVQTLPAQECSGLTFDLETLDITIPSSANWKISTSCTVSAGKVNATVLLTAKFEPNMALMLQWRNWDAGNFVCYDEVSDTTCQKYGAEKRGYDWYL